MIKLLKDLEEEIDLPRNYDIVKKYFSQGSKKGTMFFLSSLVSEQFVDNVLHSFILVPTTDDCYTSAMISSKSKSQKLGKILEALYNGVLIVFFEGEEEAFLYDVRHYFSRTVSEPEAEKAVRGSRDGFIENLIVNVSLVRRRIKSKKLKVELFIISKESQMNVALIYLDGVMKAETIKEIRAELSSLKINSLIMSDRALEENILKQGKSLFPLVRYTERPDVASINVINGKALIMVDTSASVIITPTSIIDHTRAVEEYRQNPIVGTFFKIIRITATLVSIFLLPVWLLLVGNQTFCNVFSFTASSSSNFPLVFQVLLATLIIEIFRLAMIHTPTSIGNAISLVAAIILGEVSLKVKLFLPEVLLMVSLASICSFATPSYEISLSNKVLQIILIIIVGLFGDIGFFISLILLFLYLVNIKVFKLPYLYPFCPFVYKGMKKFIIREEASKREND